MYSVDILKNLLKIRCIHECYFTLNGSGINGHYYKPQVIQYNGQTLFFFVVHCFWTLHICRNKSFEWYMCTYAPVYNISLRRIILTNYRIVPCLAYLPLYYRGWSVTNTITYKCSIHITIRVYQLIKRYLWTWKENDNTHMTAPNDTNIPNRN